MQHTKVVSDGTPAGTQVFVDGILLETTYVKFEIGIEGAGIVTVKLYAGEVHIDGAVMVETAHAKE